MKSGSLVRKILAVVWMSTASVIWVPFALLFWGNPDVFRHFIGNVARVACWILGIKIRHEGRENVDNSSQYVYVGNHQSVFDIITFGTLAFSRTVTVGKKEMAWIPFFGWAYAASGNILIDRGRKTEAIQRLQKAIDAIHLKKLSIAMFPEGTRNRSDKPLLPFKKGAFYMAVQAGVPVVPVICSSVRHLHDPNYRGPWSATLRILPPIPTRGLTDKEVPALIETVYELMLKEFLELSSHEPQKWVL